MPFRALIAVVAVVATVTFALPDQALAVSSIVPPCAVNQGSAAPSLACALETFARIAQIIVGLTGSFALLMFVYGGFLMLSSAGDSGRISQGKEAIRNALIGIVIVLTAGALITYGLNALGVKDSFLKAPAEGAPTGSTAPTSGDQLAPPAETSL